MSEGADEDTLKALREKFRHATAIALQVPEEMIPMSEVVSSSKHITMEMWAEAGSFEKIAEPGDTVDEEIADHFLNVLPPLVQKEGYFQCSEPYSHVKTDDGKFYAPTYTTFRKNREGKWVFIGNCFRNGAVDKTKEKHV